MICIAPDFSLFFFLFWNIFFYTVGLVKFFKLLYFDQITLLEVIQWIYLLKKKKKKKDYNGSYK